MGQAQLCSSPFAGSLSLAPYLHRSPTGIFSLGGSPSHPARTTDCRKLDETEMVQPVHPKRLRVRIGRLKWPILAEIDDKLCLVQSLTCSGNHQ